MNKIYKLDIRMVICPICGAEPFDYNPYTGQCEVCYFGY